MSFLFNPMAGRIGRLQWWLSQLLIIIILIVGAVAVVTMNLDTEATSIDPDALTGKMMPFMAVTAYINLCACLNRLRDSGRSGWWYLAHFIPFIGPFIIVYFCGIEKGSPNMSYDGFGDMGDSHGDADEIIRRYQSGESAAAQYTPPAPQQTQTTSSLPQPTLQTSQGFGKRKGFQGNWS